MRRTHHEKAGSASIKCGLNNRDGSLFTEIKSGVDGFTGNHPNRSLGSGLSYTSRAFNNCLGYLALSGKNCYIGCLRCSGRGQISSLADGRTHIDGTYDLANRCDDTSTALYGL